MSAPASIIQPSHHDMPVLARKAPWPIRKLMRLAGWLAPQAVAAALARRMLAPKRRTHKGREIWPPPQRETLLHKGKPLQLYRWPAQGPQLILVHGWEANSQDWSVVISVLQRQGFAITAFDAPAHGASGGSRTDVHDMAQALAAVVQHCGPSLALIAHSIGAAASAVYIDELALDPPQALVLLAPGGELDSDIGLIVQALELNASTESALRERLQQHYGRPISHCSARNALTGCELPCLIVHDEDDRVMPIWQSEQTLASLKRARLMRTRGLGHRRLLCDRRVIHAISAFLTEQAAFDSPAREQADWRTAEDMER